MRNVVEFYIGGVSHRILLIINNLKYIKMTNAKKELEQLLQGKAKVKCASITKGCQYDYEDPCPKFELKVNHTEEDFQSFLKSLNFDYNSGYGGQELFGTVWLEDGTWCTRGEYDGSEWWEHNQLPEIPSELL
jgi:hypothetical protein